MNKIENHKRIKPPKNNILLLAVCLLIFGILGFLLTYKIITINWSLLKLWPAILMFFGIESILRYFFPKN